MDALVDYARAELEIKKDLRALLISDREARGLAACLDLIQTFYV